MRVSHLVMASSEGVTVFNSLVGFLRHNLPADRPVIVRRTARAQRRAGRLSAVDKPLPHTNRQGTQRAHQIDILLHEYGHALEFEPEHGAAWGRAYARVYRTYLAWLEWFDRPSIVLEAVRCRANNPERKRGKARLLAKTSPRRKS